MQDAPPAGCWMRVAVAGATCIRLRMALRARPVVYPSSASPKAKRTMTMAASTVAPMITAPTAAMVMSTLMLISRL